MFCNSEWWDVIECNKRGSKREGNGNKCLNYKKRRSSNKQLTLHFKELRKEQTKCKVSTKKEITKMNGNKWIREQKNNRKNQTN